VAKHILLALTLAATFVASGCALFHNTAWLSGRDGDEPAEQASTASRLPNTEPMPEGALQVQGYINVDRARWEITTPADVDRLPPYVKLIGPETQIMKGMTQADVERVAGIGEGFISNLGYCSVDYPTLSISVVYQCGREKPAVASEEIACPWLLPKLRRKNAKKQFYDAEVVSVWKYLPSS
jgi:hypothetical protein